MSLRRMRRSDLCHEGMIRMFRQARAVQVTVTAFGWFSRQRVKELVRESMSILGKQSGLGGPLPRAEDCPQSGLEPGLVKKRGCLLTSVLRPLLLDLPPR